MTSAQFIRCVRMAVYDSAVEGVLSLLEKPPGRRPSQVHVALSQWFTQLSPDDKARVGKIIELSAGQAVFGMLTVLDGVTSIREGGEKGILELRDKTEGLSVLLNDPAGEPLHDLFAELVPPA